MDIESARWGAKSNEKARRWQWWRRGRGLTMFRRRNYNRGRSRHGNSRNSFVPLYIQAQKSGQTGMETDPKLIWKMISCLVQQENLLFSIQVWLLGQPNLKMLILSTILQAIAFTLPYCSLLRAHQEFLLKKHSRQQCREQSRCLVFREALMQVVMDLQPDRCKLFWETAPVPAKVCVWKRKELFNQWTCTSC